MGLLTPLLFSISLLPLLSTAQSPTPPLLTPSIKLLKVDLTKSLNLFKLDPTKIDYSTLDLSKANFVAGGGKYSLSPSVSSSILGSKFKLKNGRELLIPLPDITKTTISTKDAIAAVLPVVLKQYGVPPSKIPALAKKGVPIFTEAIEEVFAHAHGNPALVRRELTRRGLLDKIGDFFEDVGDAIVDAAETVIDKVKETFKDAACGVFAASSLPAYHLAAALFTSLNAHKESSFSQHQNFFISGLHGGIYKDGLKVIYKATQPPGFKKAYGTAFGKKSYLKHGSASTCSSKGFLEQTHLILHETTHTKQYKSYNYDLSAFGLKYLYEFCEAGMNYEKNSMEKAARTAADSTGLLKGEGMRMFQFWVAKGLQGSLGYPTEKTPRTLSTLPKKITELKFEKGALQQRNDPGFCFRRFTKAELDVRSAANCKILSGCPRPPRRMRRTDFEYFENLEDVEDLEGLEKRSPSRPPGSRPPACSAEGVAKANKSCQEKKKKWSDLEKGKKWECGVVLKACL